MKISVSVLLLGLLWICSYSQEKTNNSDEVTSLISHLNGTIEAHRKEGYVVKLPEHRSYIENVKAWVDVWVNKYEDVDYAYPWMKREDDYIGFIKIGDSKAIVLLWVPDQKLLYITSKKL